MLKKRIEDWLKDRLLRLMVWTLIRVDGMINSLIDIGERLDLYIRKDVTQDLPVFEDPSAPEPSTKTTPSDSVFKDPLEDKPFDPFSLL